MDVAGTALHVYVAGTEVFIHTHTTLTDGYNYRRASCSPNWKVSKNRLCSLSPFLATTPSCQTTWRTLSPPGTEGLPHPSPGSTPSPGTGTPSPPKQDGHVSSHHHFKGERAYLALQSLIQKEETNQMCFETCLWLERRQTRVDLVPKTSILTCTMYTAAISNPPLASAKALSDPLVCSSEICWPASVTSRWPQGQDNRGSAQGQPKHRNFCILQHNPGGVVHGVPSKAEPVSSATCT